jgi:HSP20 family protein
MNALTRIDRVDDLFSDFFRRFARSMPAGFETAAPPAEIRLDVTEHEKDYVVRAEVPGAKKEGVRVQIDGNYVSISTEVKQEQERKDDKGRVLLKETSIGSATRGFTLGCEIDDKAASARLEEGVLVLTLPKRQGTGSRMISVQ